ncbi:unnamed protein product [Miscanthus lutarioriparius]|uniref:Uncharacterized protein n=1 Tax=Miscanthus lutarioriparius TaxID=422564 RepID=A0A811N708_9POAL|nr:unnamed protein product [Miscanthus lutarioriparius]
MDVGVNLINLDKWREHNVTENYLLLMKKFKVKDELSYDGKDISSKLAILATSNISPR